MTHLESGWTLSVFPSGIVQLESDKPRDPLREIDADFDRALELWTTLAEGDISRLLKANWREVES